MGPHTLYEISNSLIVEDQLLGIKHSTKTLEGYLLWTQC